MEGYLDRKELAAWLDESERTIARRDSQRKGPPRVKFGRKWMYPIPLARKWLEAQIEYQLNAPGLEK